MDWGSVPDWVAGIGTAGALISAVLLLRRERWDRLSNDAQAVSVWWAYQFMNQLSVYAKNTGPRAVYGCIVRFGAGERDRKEIEIEVLPPGEERHDQIEGDWQWAADEPSMLEMEVELTDSAGNRWKRDREGRTMRLSKRGKSKHP